MKKRGCTDLLCCALFVVFLLAQLLVADYAYKNGDPMKLA